MIAYSREGTEKLFVSNHNAFHLNSYEDPNYEVTATM